MSAKVTIAIPTLNRSGYFRMALESARAQTYENVEIVVSDNASTDNTPVVISAFEDDPRVRAFRQNVKLSMVDNWNACVAAATGDYFLMLSDDDLLEPEAIEALVGGFEHGPLPQESVGVVYCQGRVIDENGSVSRLGGVSPLWEKAEDMMLGFFRSRRATWACTILFRRSDILAGYTPELPLMTDAAQWMQAIARHGNAVFIERVLASYREHQNISAKTPVELWQRDARVLGEMAIGWLRENARGDENQYREIRNAMEKLSVRFIPALLNQRYGTQKLKTLSMYAKHWRYFMSVFGVYTASVGVARLLAPGLIASGKQLRGKLLTKRR